MAIQLYTTNDQSHTLYNSELDETYHSRNGAIEESLYVFLKQGFAYKTPFAKSIRVLEVGFGTGLNTILTLEAAETNQIDCRYVSLETYPLPFELIGQLNYQSFIATNYHTHFQQIHTCKWNAPQRISPYFELLKMEQSIQTFKDEQPFDLVYYDAFGPNKQPDMWTLAIFEKLFNQLNKGGVFVTYSAKGEVRRSLKNIGFEVELLPGPPRKRHMLRAIKP